MRRHTGEDGESDNRRLTLAFSIEGGIEGRAHGCRLGADGRRDLARHGRPAHRAALAGPGGRALFAGSHHPIIRGGSHFGGYLVRVRSALVWLRLEHENHPGAQPDVIVLVHNLDYRQDRDVCTYGIAPSASAAAGQGNHAHSHPRRRRGAVLAVVDVRGCNAIIYMQGSRPVVISPGVILLFRRPPASSSGRAFSMEVPMAETTLQTIPCKTCAATFAEVRCDDETGRMFVVTEAGATTFEQTDDSRPYVERALTAMMTRCESGKCKAAQRLLN